MHLRNSELRGITKEVKTIRRAAGGGNDVMWKYGKHFMFPTFPHHLENGKAVSHIPTTLTTICIHLKIKEKKEKKPIQVQQSDSGLS